MSVRLVIREVMLLASEGKAARSRVKRPCWVSMVPRRVMRRPFWSWLRILVNLNWGMRDSAVAFDSGWRSVVGGVIFATCQCCEQTAARDMLQVALLTRVDISGDVLASTPSRGGGAVVILTHGMH